MKTPIRFILAFSLGILPTLARTQDPVDPRAEIAAVGSAYVTAFNKGDAPAVAAFWLPEGDYIDSTGSRHEGRTEIAKLFTDFFKDNAGAQLTIDSGSVRFINSDLAIEDGTTTVSLPKAGPPTTAGFSNLFVRKDGKWLLASVREFPVRQTGDRTAELAGLGWLLGPWQAATKTGEKIVLTVEPGPNDNFLVLHRSVYSGDNQVGGGMECIAWDPAQKIIRSWSFDDDGGFGESRWKPQDKTWQIETTHTLRSGSRVDEMQSLTLEKDGSVTAKSLSTSLDGKVLDPVETLKFTRPE